MISINVPELIGDKYKNGFIVTVTVKPRKSTTQRPVELEAPQSINFDDTKGYVNRVPNVSTLPVSEPLPEPIEEHVLVTEPEIPNIEMEIPIPEQILTEPTLKHEVRLSKGKAGFPNIVNGFRDMAWGIDEDGKISIRKGTVITKTTWEQMADLAKLDVADYSRFIRETGLSMAKQGTLRAFVAAIRADRIDIPVEFKKEEIEKVIVEETKIPMNNFITPTKVPLFGWLTNKKFGGN